MTDLTTTTDLTDDATDETCYNCGAELNEYNETVDVDFCAECYINDECPAHCSEVHPAPPGFSWRRGNEWECPSTGDTYYWLGRTPLYGRDESINGEWVDYETTLVTYCGVSQYVDMDETFYCDGCGESCHNDSYEADGRCSSCYESYYEDEDRGGCVVDAFVHARCDHKSPGGPGCYEKATHWDPMSENVFCALHAGNNPAIPTMPVVEKVKVLV